MRWTRSAYLTIRTSYAAAYRLPFLVSAFTLFQQTRLFPNPFYQGTAENCTSATDPTIVFTPIFFAFERLP